MARAVFNRIRSALRYLARAAPPHAWRLSRSTCPNCAGTWFLSLRHDAFMTRCLRCHANATNLSLIPVIQSHQGSHRTDCAWEMSTYGATLDYLRRNVAHVHCSEYFVHAAPGAFVDGIMNQDVQNLAFADDSLDLITSNQVFEHVPDDLRGYRECFRVLRAGGALIFTIPLHDIPATQQLATLRDRNIEFLTAPEFHDSRLQGPRSAPCFWRHSFHDVAARVATADFTVELVEVRITSIASTWVVYALKA